MLRRAPNGATRVAAVIGNPVRHSLSPALHNAAFEAAGLDWTYVALECADGRRAVEAMRTLGIGGMSVTMPHKQAVAASVDRRSAAVEALGAANCVRWDGDQLVGENTDGDGFVRSLVEIGLDMENRRCVIVGAGGAARSILQALETVGAADIAVVNRTESRAIEAAAIAPLCARVGSFDDIASADLVINSTPIGMGDDAGLSVPVDLIGPDHVVADLIYHPALTPLLAGAASRGARTLNGLAMLVHQAAIQFEHWTGQPASVEAMCAAVGLTD
ncbi:MAG: shikimate dehydrogenase [Actinomycetia bacterium]|nr:shikimate dehydrogenase [Actinomycetes bacterium]MCP4958888.1 shikimate dehydrogenase [Actinomycetes bacterium]